MKIGSLSCVKGVASLLENRKLVLRQKGDAGTGRRREMGDTDWPVIIYLISDITPVFIDLSKQHISISTLYQLRKAEGRSPTRAGWVELEQLVGGGRFKFTFYCTKRHKKKVLKEINFHQAILTKMQNNQVLTYFFGMNYMRT